MPRFRGRGRWRVFVALASVLGAGAAGGWVVRAVLFPGLLARGAAAYDRGDWPAAADLAAARLKAAPGDRDALRLLARTAGRRQRDESARALYSRRGGAEAMEAEDFLVMGGVIDRTGDHSAARVCWVSGLIADPKHPGLLDHFARLYLREGQFEQASGVARALARRPGWEARGDLFLGRIALEQDDPVAAAEALRRALDRDPTVREAGDPPGRTRTLLGRALLRAGRPGPAATVLRAVLAAAPDAEASWLLSRASLQAGSPAEAAAALPQGAAYRAAAPDEPEPAPYVGAARCAECHRDNHRTQQGSLHARTFLRRPAPADLPLPARPVDDPAAAAVRHTIGSVGDQVTYATESHGATVRAVVDYVFGSGHHGRTLVGRDAAGATRELRLSNYADGPSWDLTTGQPKQPPPGEGFLGRTLGPDEVLMCFYCHATVARFARDGTGPEPADRAIGCERCHGPGGNHLKAVAAKFPDPAIAELRAAPAARVIALCGQCHSPFKAEAARTNPVSVRFPGGRAPRESGTATLRPSPPSTKPSAEPVTERSVTPAPPGPGRERPSAR